MGSRLSGPMLHSELQLGACGDLENRLLEGSINLPLHRRRSGDDEEGNASSSSGPLQLLHRSPTHRRKPRQLALPDDWFTGPPLVTGDHDLRGEELMAVLELKDARSSAGIRLEKPKGVSRSSVYFMCLVNKTGDEVLPTVIKVKKAAAAAREAKATMEGVEHFGHYAMRLLDHVTDEENDIGVLQLEISGSRCCIPRFVNAFEETVEFGQEFENSLLQVDAGQHDRDANFQRVLRMVHELFMVILRPCTLRNLEDHRDNFMTLCLGPETVPDPHPQKQGSGGSLSGTKKAATADGTKPRTRILGSVKERETKFGPAYYDGKVVLDSFGGLMSDIEGSQNRAEMLRGLVEKATGEHEAPTSFFAKFFSIMESLPRHVLNLPSARGIVHHDLHYGNVMVDADDRVWLIDLETLKMGHPFADLSKGFASGVFAYAGDVPSEDEEVLQRLMLLWASIPESFVDDVLPPPPDHCAGSTGGVWNFAKQMQLYFASFTRGVVGAGHAFEKPHVQVLWGLFVVAVQMVTYKQNAKYPRRKRLALFLSLAVGARLLHELASAARPSWLTSHQSQWHKASAADPLSLVRTNGVAEAALQRYAATLRAREAWIRDPFINQRFDVMKDMLDVKLSSGRVSCPTAGPKDLSQLMQENFQLLVVGEAGSGKTVLTKQCVTYLMNEAKLGSRIPVRISLLDMKPYLNNPGADLLHTYITCNRNEAEAKIILKAREEAGLVLILDGLDEGDPQRQWAFQWIKDLRAREERHWVLVTTRPSALMTPGVAGGKASDCISWIRQQQFLIHNAATSKGGFPMEEVEHQYVKCKIKEFDSSQVVSLCRSRLGEEMAQAITPLLLEDGYASLTQVPLLATMLMHMLVRELHGIAPRTSQCDVYNFAFTHLLRHVDTSKRRSSDEYDAAVVAGAEDLLMRIAYNKQVMRERTIKKSDFGPSEVGQRLWRLAHEGQCALFSAEGQNHIKFFHLTMQEYLAAVHALKLMADGQPFLAWLIVNNSYAVGVHRFLGELAASRGFPFTEDQQKAFQAPHVALRKYSLPRALMRLLEAAMANQDRFAVAGLCELFAVTGVKDVRIDLKGQGLKSAKLVARGIAELIHLDNLWLNFEWCMLLKSCGSLGAAWGRLTKLKDLCLVFDGCVILRNIDDLCKGLAHLTRLEALEISFRHCRKIRDANDLGRALWTLESLTTFSLDCEGCLLLSDVEDLWRGIGELTKLVTMRLVFQSCVSISSVEELGISLSRLSNLSSFILKLNGTDGVEDLEPVCTGIAGLRSLRFLLIDAKVRAAYFAMKSTKHGHQLTRRCMLWTSILVEFLRTSKLVVLLVFNLIWASCIVHFHKLNA